MCTMPLIKTVAYDLVWPFGGLLTSTYFNLW